MFISVDFPAPFSPSRACTSPSLRPKSTWPFASTPGNRFVMPRSPRTAGASIRRDSMRLKTTSGAEAPDAVVLRCTQCTEAAEARNGEDDVRAGRDLVLGDVLAEILLDEVLRVALEHGRARDALLRPRLVAGEKDVDRRDLDAADDA